MQYVLDTVTVIRHFSGKGKIGQAAAHIKRTIDILITHAPPLGIHDKPDLCHHGFKVFRRFIERYRPRYFIHGHTHRYNTRDAWKTQHRHTSVINTCGCRVLEI